LKPKAFERRSTMFNSGLRIRAERTPVIAAVLLASCILGCTTKQERALEQAKLQAAKTGQAQQVVSVDKNGTTTTTIVQPPVSGQTQQATTTTTTPPAPGAKTSAASDPVVSAVSQTPSVPAEPVSEVIPAGSRLTIRIDQHISVKTSRTGDNFSGELVEPALDSNNNIVAPKGTLVGGVVDASARRGHFKGRSLLELRLTSMTLSGVHYRLATRDLERTKKGKGKRSAAMIGGGAGLGMLVGGIATGGVGLVVGGLAGGGAGTAAAGLTGNRDIDIPAESIVHFTLEDDLVVQQPQ
jgi:hypothetical protein